MSFIIHRLTQFFAHVSAEAALTQVDQLVR